MHLSVFRDEENCGQAFRGIIYDHEVNTIRNDIAYEVKSLVASKVAEMVMTELEPKLNKLLKELF